MLDINKFRVSNSKVPYLCLSCLSLHTAIGTGAIESSVRQPWVLGSKSPAVQPREPGVQVALSTHCSPFL